MLEWEAPPTFSTSQGPGYDVLLSKSQLNVLSRDLDYLTGQADGERLLFSGVFCEEYPSQDSGATIWEGWVEHQKTDFSYVYWNRASVATSAQFIYNGSELGVIELDAEANWTQHTDTYDLSGRELVAGSMYGASMWAKLDGDETAGCLFLSALYESCAIQGYTGPPTFTDTDMGDLSGSLTTTGANLSVLKSSADAPILSFAGPEMSDTIIDDTWREVRYREDEQYSNGDEFRFGGGCICPGSTFSLRAVVRAGSGTAIRFVLQSAAGAWGGWEPSTTGCEFEATGFYDFTLDMSGCADQGEWCRVIAQVKGQGEDQHDTFGLYYASVFAEEDYSASPLPRWSHGDNNPAASLNQLSSRTEWIRTGGKLGHYINFVMRRVGSRDPDLEREGGRVGIIRKRGTRYLHYYLGELHNNPAIRFYLPAQSGSEIEEHTHHLGDTACGVWHTLDIEQLDLLYPGMLYTLDEVEAAQERRTL